jgi:hypothetical protein
MARRIAVVSIVLGAWVVVGDPRWAVKLLVALVMAAAVTVVPTIANYSSRLGFRCTQAPIQGGYDRVTIVDQQEVYTWVEETNGPTCSVDRAERVS